MFFETDPARHFCKPSPDALQIFLVSKDDWKAKKGGYGEKVRNWAEAVGFRAKSGQHCIAPDSDGKPHSVLFGMGGDDEGGKALAHSKLARLLPKGKYVLNADGEHADLQALGWAMGGYSFDRYRKRGHETPQLAVSLDPETRHTIEAVFMARDLINIPANDMGPDALEAAFRQLADQHKAQANVTKGDALLESGFPMVHAVGRASDQAPRVLDLTWGDESHPKVTLVGKGVTFDTGGLNIKPGSSMALMKKDMGGAANVMALAHLIMAQKLPVRLRLIVGAVENSISANAFRPGDVLQTRKGITVEIGNTDAEGRLVLGDCLTLGDEENPDLMIDMATLTGAARVALGPDLPPFYTFDDSLAADLETQGNIVSDPLWRMPLWQPYQSMLSSQVADVNHITSGGFAGSITAALFLSQFVEKSTKWAHFDIFGWTPIEKPYAPVGGEAQGIRALYATLKHRYPS